VSTTRGTYPEAGSKRFARRIPGQTGCMPQVIGYAHFSDLISAIAVTIF
jgi:hypothetical protein